MNQRAAIRNDSPRRTTDVHINISTEQELQDVKTTESKHHTEMQSCNEAHKT